VAKSTRDRTLSNKIVDVPLWSAAMMCFAISASSSRPPRSVITGERLPSAIAADIRASFDLPVCGIGGAKIVHRRHAVD